MGMASPQARDAWASRQNDPKLHAAIDHLAREMPGIVARTLAYHRACRPRPLTPTVTHAPRNRGRARRGRHRARVTRGPPEDDDPHHDRRHDAVGRALVVGSGR